MPLSRRQFLALSSSSAIAALLADMPSACSQQSPGASALRSDPRRIGFGPLQPDPEHILDLPMGFRYRVLSKQGDPMTDGLPVPGAADGMAAFADAQGNTILIRNHELSTESMTAVGAPRDRLYDRAARGGTTTLVVSPQRQLLRQYGSLAGTMRNCAGGATPWGSWLSCEEDVSWPSSALPGGVTQPHGYVFEVPSTATAPVDPHPLVALGRFRHEAIAVDPRTGILYQTEDQEDGLFYRFIPHQPGVLGAGGLLQALRIVEQPQAITATGVPRGLSMAVDWVTIETPNPTEDTVRVEGFQKGAAQFSRGEGVCYGDGLIYFTCTNGGNVPRGQVWRYRPGRTLEDGGQLDLFVQPDDPAVLDYPDNLIVAPWGDLLLCEDGWGTQFVVGATPDGQLYPFARNAFNSAEFAGICCSPDGSTLFLNIYNPTLTVAIWRDR